MGWFFHFLRSSIGSKMAMALTGLALLLFAIAHMAGNLQIFLGADTLNAYARSLRLLPGGLLWIMRIGLIAVVLIHIYAALRLVVQNRAARPVGYVVKKTRVTGYAARTMKYSGVIILAFVVYHLAHYTFLWVNPEFAQLTDELGRPDVYSMLIKGFSNVGVVAFYIVAVGLLCVHLAHGIPSFFQSLGLRHPRYERAVEIAGPVIAALLFLGFAVVPVAVITKVIGPVTGGA